MTEVTVAVGMMLMLLIVKPWTSVMCVVEAEVSAIEVVVAVVVIV